MDSCAGGEGKGGADRTSWVNLVVGPNEQVDNALVSKKGDWSEELAFRRILERYRELQECSCRLANWRRVRWSS